MSTLTFFNRLKKFFFLLVYSLSPEAASGTPPLGDLTIPANRVPNWYLPATTDTSSWTVMTVPARDCADNTTNDQDLIQAAINSAGPRTILQLEPNCTYNLVSGTIALQKSDIVLRGAGLSTSIKVHHTSAQSGGSLCGAAFVRVCGTASAGANVNWVGGYSVGTTDLTLSDGGSFAVGDWVQTEAAFPAELGEGDTVPGPNGARNEYIAQVIAKPVANVIRLDRGLRMDASNRAAFQPVVRKLTPIERVGLESIKIVHVDRTNSGLNYRPAIDVANAVNSWVRDVTVYGWYNVMILTRNAARNLFERLWLTDLFYHPWNEAAFSFDVSAVDSVAQNSLFTRNYVDVKIQQGASGNAWLYNYHRRAGVDACHVPSRSRPLPATEGLERAIYLHGLANESLVEGNDTECSIEMDSWWGSQAYRNTFFRNRVGLNAPTVNANPYGFVTEISADDGIPNYPVAFFPNFLLNTTSSFHGKFTHQGSGGIDNMTSAVPVQAMWFERNLSLGALSVLPRSDTSRVNNVQNAQSTAWSGFSAPASLIYVNARPQWWLNAPWPALGADLDVLGSHLSKIPAQCRFEGSVAGDCEGGSGTPMPTKLQAPARPRVASSD